MTTLAHDPNAPVIMVDDSEDDIEIARLCYEDSWLKNPFVGLTSGDELLEYLLSVERGEATMPAVVLLDINMPAKDGFTVLKEVRCQSRFQRMPIIMMLTNSDNPRDLKNAMDFGANRYQTKMADANDYVAFFNSLANDDRLRAA